MLVIAFSNANTNLLAHTLTDVCKYLHLLILRDGVFAQ